MAINLIVTNAGRAALINAQNNGTNAVQFAKCGISATNANYTAASIALQNELKRIDNISGSALSPDTINLAFADTSTDAYDLRSFAIYLADNTLFAIASQATPIYSKTNNTDGLLSVNIKFSDISTSQITFANYNLVNPPSTEITAGVIEIATQTETNAGTDDLRAITPKKLTAFWNSKSAWTINNDGAGSGLDADLLDGQHGAYFLDLANATNTLPSARLSGTYNISISGNAVTADNATNATNATNASNATKLGNILAANYWHSANDGAGSGLDADLLDGYHAGGFLRFDASDFYFRTNATNGYISFVQGSNTTTGYVAFYKADTTRMGYIGYGYNSGAINIAADNSNYYNFSGGQSPCVNGNIIWHSGNDGAGSGLDADLFDGYNSDYFLSKTGGNNFFDASSIERMLGFNTGNIGGAGTIALFGRPSDGAVGLYSSKTNEVPYIYYPVTKTFSIEAQNFAYKSNIVWHSGNDGAGSGLDADLLDGLDSSAFAKLSGANFTGSVGLNGNLDVDGGDINIKRTTNYWGYVTRPNVAGYKNLQFATQGGGSLDNLELNSLNLTTRSNQIWHAGNDGAGSGSDADLLDGQHGAYYWSDGRASKSLAANGYRILPDGTIEQWGEATLTGDINQVVSFPIAFPNQCLQAVGCQGGDFAVNTDAGAGVQSFTNSTITLRNGSWMTTKIRYFAIGN